MDRLLLVISLEEGDVERLMTYYRRLRESKPFGRFAGHPHLEAQVADAVVHVHPDEAIAIWDRLARAEIAGASRPHYEQSLTYLRPMQTVLLEAGREDEWDAYLNALRDEHSRKYALQQTLDRLNRGPIMNRSTDEQGERK